ncbi:MAG TPA: aromatic ring-hydroxylating dioxygenase subunit alpha [Sphingomonadaceae bacterium]|nr:aromatic ring-hydroxylating dioxygenase subunit alpha [Sphingomonadaceae bacterium]
MHPFAEGCFAVENAWYVAALADEITRTPMERWFLDQPVVLYRKQDGEAVALDGRCPHRMYPMAAGRLEGDVLVCSYHGIAFGPNGRCTRIPTQDRVPPAFGIRKFPLVEKWKWLWIWMGDPDAADESLIPDHDALELHDEDLPNGTYSVPLNHYDVKGRYQLLHDNLLDLSHLAYLHETSIGTEGVATTRDEVTSGEGWVRSARHVVNAEAPPWTKERHGIDKIDFVIDFTFHLPAIHVGQNRTSTSSDSDKPGEILQETIVYHAITPATRTTAHYFFAMTVKKGQPKSQAMTVLKDGIDKIIAEDIFASEEIERLLPREGRVRELMTAGDVAVVKGRKMLENLIKREMEARDRSRPATSEASAA